MLKAQGRNGGPSERGAWWRVFVFAALAIGAWAFAVPVATGPDEPAQLVRAAGVVRGDIIGRHVPGSRNLVTEVRAPAGYQDLGPAAECFIGELPDGMRGEPMDRADVDQCNRVGRTDDVERLMTIQYRGQPLVYALAGVPSLWFTGEHGLYLMRVVTTLLGAAFIASAWLSVRRLCDPPTAAVALAATLTPVALYFSGVVNPIGLEMATALSAWAAGLALATSPAAPTGRLVARAGLALSVLAVTRGLGPGFAVVVVAGCAVVADPDRRRALVRRADVRVWSVLLAACLAASVGWLLYLQREFPLPERLGSGVAGAFDRLPWWGRELIAVFGVTDVVPPVALHLVWAAVTLAVLWVAARHSRVRDLALALMLMVGGAALLVSGEGLSIPQTGYWWQGRYVYPLVAGGLLVAGAGVGRSRRDAPSERAGNAGGERSAMPAPLRATLLAAMFVCHVWAFGYALRHHTVGHDGTLDPIDILFRGEWTPVVGTAWLWTACLVVGVAGLTMTAWRTRPAGDLPGGDPADRPTGASAAAPDRTGPTTVALGVAP